MTDSFAAVPESGLSPWLYALRRLWMVVAAILVGVPTLVILVGGPARDEYRAVATIAAVELATPVDGLARLAEAAFRTTDVAERIRRQVPAGGNPLLPPESTTIEPVRDTILIRVLATDRDPERARSLANAAADALVAELNEIGPGLGRFEVTDRARQPAIPVSTVAPATRILAGTLGALGLTIAVVTTWVSLWRPVLSARELQSLAGGQWHAEVVVPSGLGRYPRPERIVGLGQVPAPSDGSIIVAGVSSGELPRLQLSAAIASALSRHAETELVLVGSNRDASDEAIPGVRVTAIGPGEPLPSLDPGARRVIDVSGREIAVDLIDAGGPAAVILLADLGAPARRVSNIAAGIEPTRLEGVVLVRRAV